MHKNFRVCFRKRSNVNAKQRLKFSLVLEVFACLLYQVSKKLTVWKSLPFNKITWNFSLRFKYYDQVFLELDVFISALWEYFCTLWAGISFSSIFWVDSLRREVKTQSKNIKYLSKNINFMLVSFTWSKKSRVTVGYSKSSHYKTIKAWWS